MKDNDLIHLPEYYLKFGSLKKHLKKVYKLNLSKKVKKMKDPRITEEVKDQLEEKIITSFMSTEFISSRIGHPEEIDIEFQTDKDGGVDVDQLLLTLGPVDTEALNDGYPFYLAEANKWAKQHGLFVGNIFSDVNAREMTYVFDIVDLDKAIAVIAPAPPEIDYPSLFLKIEDRISKIQKHSTEIKMNPSDAEELELIYERLRAIEENCDTAVANANRSKPGATMAKPGETFWATLVDRNGKVKERMEVTFKEEAYAKSAFKAAGLTVADTDTINFE